MPSKEFHPDMVASDGTIVSPSDSRQARLYTDMGYKQAQVADIKRDEIRKVYDTWQGSVAAFGSGIMTGIPFLQTAATGLTQAFGGKQAAQDYAEEQKTLTDIHPFIGGVGQAVGTLATAGALGVGAGATTMRQVASGVVGNAAMSAVNHIDRAALAHAIEPGGEEKILAHMGTDVLFDALVGGALPLAAAGVSKLARAGSKLSQGLAESQLRKSLLDNKAVEAITQQGRQTELGSLLDQEQLWGLQPAEARAKIAPKLKALATEYNDFKAEFKYRMLPNKGGHLADNLGNILGKEYPEIAETVQQKLIEHGHAPSVGELHDMRQSIDRQINWGVVSEQQLLKQQPLQDARNLVSRELRAVIAQSDPATGGAMAEKWRTLDRDYANLSLLDGAIKKAKPAGEDKTPWFMAMLASSLGGSSIGGLFGGWAGAKTLNQAFKDGALHGPAKAMGKIFATTADKLTQATEAGLLGAGVEASLLLHEKSHGSEEYDIKAATVKHGMGDPIRSIGQLTQAVQKHSGLPDDMAQAATLRANAMHQFLYSQLPKNPDPPMGAKSPSTFRPSLEARTKWMGLYNTLNDPTYGVLNPTKDNIGALRQFYPETLASVQQAVLQQVQSNSELSMDAQLWSTRIMGYPTGRLVSPRFYSALNNARQYNAQKAQEKQGAGNSGNSSGNDVNSGLTRIQQLQNRNAKE